MENTMLNIIDKSSYLLKKLIIVICIIAISGVDLLFKPISAYANITYSNTDDYSLGKHHWKKFNLDREQTLLNVQKPEYWHKDRGGNIRSSYGRTDETVYKKDKDGIKNTYLKGASLPLVVSVA